MTEEQERAAFEAWRRSTTKMSPDDAVAREGLGDDADYANRATRAMWIGWKGRAAAPSAEAPTGEGAEPVAPWPDFLGQPIRHGARLTHPDGTEFVAVRLNGYPEEGDTWRCIYDNDPQHISRLCLQIGDKGRAVLAQAATGALDARTVHEIEPDKRPKPLRGARQEGRAR